MGLTAALTTQKKINVYPEFPTNSINSTFIDNFTREAITPTGAYTLYTSASNDGNGSSGITSGNRLHLTTDTSAAGDDESVRLSGFALQRIPTSTVFTSTRNAYKITIVFSITGALTTEGFIGISDQIAALTALPTTARHLGVYWDISAQANWRITSANGTDQVDTDTGEALDTGINRLEIEWTGTNAAVIKFFNGADATTASATQTVTAFGMGTGELHFFIQTETTAARVLHIREYRIDTT